MKKMFKIILLILSPAILFGLYVLGNIIYSTITDYKPAEKIELPIEGNCEGVTDSTFSFLIWNIGYGGLGASSDFFYDGGKAVRSERSQVEKYVSEIYGFTEKQKSVDFILFQEVDQRSKRSYETNEYEGLTRILDKHCRSFASNYKVNFIPIPFTRPMGKVHSGLASYSKFKPSSATRYQFPGNFDYPKSLFFLDRCFLMQQFGLKNGKELIVINTHNSAYDDGTLKKQQMEYLKAKILEEYSKGNYVIVGGDWNQCPPGFECFKFAKQEETDYQQNNIDSKFLPDGWQWVYDGSIPTNRKVKTTYDPATTFTTVIDFYLVSPNVTVLEKRGIDLQFSSSDHQPVFMKVQLDNL